MNQKAAITISRLSVIVISAYIAFQMVADIASIKIGIVLGLAVDMGTFIYPITFTLRDIVHKVLGKRGAQTVVISAGVINVLMAGYMLWVSSVPGDTGWGLFEEFRAIFSPTLMRIVLASIAAEVISELLDTEIYHWFVNKITRRFQWLRVLTSNSVSIPVDNLIFVVGAFGWQEPWSVVFQIFLFNLVVKYAVTLISLPMIYLVPDRDEGSVN